MFERPLLYLVPPYAAMLLIAVRFGLVPSPFLCLPALAVLLIGAAFAVRHRRAFTVLAMLCAAVFALVQLSLCDRYLAQPVRELNGRSAVVRATVLQDASVYEDSQRAELRVEPNRYLRRSFRTFCYLPLSDTPLCAGDRIEAHVTFYRSNPDRERSLAADGCFIAAFSTKNKSGDVIGFERLGSASGSPRYLPQRIARFCKNAVSAALPEREAGLLRGLLLGDRTDMSDDDTLSFRMAGLSHLVAVSGLHVGYLAAFCFVLLGRKWGVYLSLPLILLFVPVAGATPSVIRAAVMYGITALGFILRRDVNPKLSLMAALALLLLLNPYAAAGAGLQLSFSATLGLILFASSMQHRLLAPFAECARLTRRLLAFPAGALSCTVCASIFTLPVSLVCFGRASLLSLLANLPAAALTGMCFVFGYLLCAVSALCPAVLPVFAVPLRLMLRFLLILAERISLLPFGSIDLSRPLGIAALALAGGAVIVWLTAGSRVRWRIVLPLVCCTVGGLFLTDAVLRTGEYSVTYLPCGSGQAVILSDTRGHTTLIDCAGTSRSAAALTHEWMRLNGVPRIDTLILTAVDMGHARDLPQLMENVRVDRILIPSGCTETAKNMELLRLCEQYQAEEISEKQSIIGAAAPVSVFPVAEGKLGVCIADKVLFLHSATKKQLAAFAESGGELPRADELMLAQNTAGDAELLVPLMNHMQTRKILVTAERETTSLRCGSVPCESTDTSGGIVRRYKKE